MRPSRAISVIALALLFMSCGYSANSTSAGYAIHDFKRGRDYGDLLRVHGIVVSNVESILIIDENCPDRLFGLKFPKEVLGRPNVKHLLRVIRPSPEKPSDEAVFATLLVKPIYDRSRYAILHFEFIKVVSEEFTSASSGKSKFGAVGNCE